MIFRETATKSENKYGIDYFLPEKGSTDAFYNTEQQIYFLNKFNQK